VSTALTADLAPAPDGPRHSAGTADVLPALGDPAERGALTVADKVVERVAGYAVTQVDGVSAAPRRVLGVTVGEPRDDKEASVTARVDGHTATIQTSVAIAWPASAREVAGRLRSRVRDDVERMTGMRVAHVDVDVVSMSTPTSRSRRVQ